MLPSKPVHSGPAAPVSASPSSAAHSEPGAVPPEPETPCRVVSYRTRKLCLSHGRCCDAVYGAEPAPVMSRAEREALCAELPRLAALDPGHRGDHPLVFDLLSDTLGDFAREGRLADLLALGLRRAAVLDLWRARGKPGRDRSLPSTALVDELSRHGPPPIRDAWSRWFNHCDCEAGCVSALFRPEHPSECGPPRSDRERRLISRTLRSSFATTDVFDHFRDEEMADRTGSVAENAVAHWIKDFRRGRLSGAVTQSTRSPGRIQGMLVKQLVDSTSLVKVADAAFEQSRDPDDLRLRAILIACEAGDARLARHFQSLIEAPAQRMLGLALLLFSEPAATALELVRPALAALAAPEGEPVSADDRLARIALNIALQERLESPPSSPGTVPESPGFALPSVPDSEIGAVWLALMKRAAFTHCPLYDRVADALPIRMSCRRKEDASAVPPIALGAFLCAGADLGLVRRVMRTCLNHDRNLCRCHGPHTIAAEDRQGLIKAAIEALVQQKEVRLAEASAQQAYDQGLLTKLDLLRLALLACGDSGAREWTNQTTLGRHVQRIHRLKTMPERSNGDLLSSSRSPLDRIDWAADSAALFEMARGIQYGSEIAIELAETALRTPANATWTARTEAAAELLALTEAGQSIGLKAVLDAGLIGAPIPDLVEDAHSTLLALARSGRLDVGDREVLRRAARSLSDRDLSDEVVLVDALVLEGALLDPDRYGEGVLDQARWDEMIIAMNRALAQWTGGPSPVLAALKTWSPSALLIVDHHVLAMTPDIRRRLFRSLQDHARESGDLQAGREFARLSELLEEHPVGEELEPCPSIDPVDPRQRGWIQRSWSLRQRAESHKNAAPKTRVTFGPTVGSAIAAHEAGEPSRAVELARCALRGRLESTIEWTSRSFVVEIFQHSELARRLLPELVRLVEREQARGERRSIALVSTLIDGLLVIPELEDGDFRRLLRMRPGNVGLRRIAAAVTRHDRLDRLAKVIERASDSEEVAAIVGAVKAALRLAGREIEALATDEVLDAVSAEREELLRPWLGEES